MLANLFADANLYIWLASFFGFFMAFGLGANDLSNAMGTSVGSGALSIRQAVILAAIFEFLGAFLAGGEVSDTISRGFLASASIELAGPKVLILGMLSALLSSSIWLCVASFFGWPVSTTHTIVGAVVGFGLYRLGFDGIVWANVLKVLGGWIFSPLLGGVLAWLVFWSLQKFIFHQPEPFTAAKRVGPIYVFLVAILLNTVIFKQIQTLGWQFVASTQVLWSVIVAISVLLTILASWFMRRLDWISFSSDYLTHSSTMQVEKVFIILMVLTSCAMAFAHGSNDVANAIGPLSSIVHLSQPKALILASAGHVVTPTWVLFLGASGIVLGLATLGHRVMATIGNDITQLTPSRGFSVTIAAALTVILASKTGLPVSTTHTLVGGILGVGLARGMHAINLKVVTDIMISWVITVPLGATLSILAYMLLSRLL